MTDIQRIDPPFELRGRRVAIVARDEMVTGPMKRRLEEEGCEVALADANTIDVRRQAEVEDWMAEQRPEVVVAGPARVGGILANSRYPAEFMYDNLAIELHTVEAAWRLGVDKLVMLSSSCIYPRLAEQPIREEALLTGPLEKTNESYAVARIAGVKLCQAYRQQYGCDYISIMATNLFGPEDDFDLENSHVISALLRKVHEAKKSGAPSVEIWGTGNPRREFLFVDDFADATAYLLKYYSGDLALNVGIGGDVSIRELAETIKKVVGYEGSLDFDTSKPDGTPRKLLDVSRLTALGWAPRTPLEDGLRRTYEWYVANVAPQSAASGQVAEAAASR
jgi:GDP-L-fucose synthase